MVSTLAVEWIEMAKALEDNKAYVVSTLAVEWIEIFCFHSRAEKLASPPSRWSGLKSNASGDCETVLRLHPRGGVD